MGSTKWRMSKGLSAIIPLGLLLAACGSGSLNSNSATPAPPPNAAPSITLATTPALVAYNNYAVITWSSTNSSSCSSAPAGINTTSGSYTTPPLTVTTTYAVTCVGPGGTASKNVVIAVAGSSIASVAAAWAATPMRGTVHYYCDCGTGASSSCVAGNDANDGLSTATPKRTIAAAMAHFSSLSSGDTVALCQGGAFTTASTYFIGSSGRCAAGVACNDLRDFTPTTFTATAKPIINYSGNANIFTFQNGDGGVRILNLALNNALNPYHGNNPQNGSHVVFIYKTSHDITFGNVTMDGFQYALYAESNAGNVSNIVITGNTITNNISMGWLGGGDNVEISYNYWDGNGSDSVFDHTIYIGSEQLVSNIQVVGNYIHGQSSPTCLGAPIVGHLNVNGLNVSGNVVDIAAAATTGGCWGIAFDNGGYPTAVSLQNARFSGNTIKNGGNTALTVANCPDCVIENNLIVNETFVGGTGISIPDLAARTSPADGVSTRNLVRNNTIWFGPNATSGGLGIRVGTEGTGHVIANNSVYYSAASTGSSGPFNCFSYSLALGSYAFINNNHCYSAAAYSWEATRGSLAAWRTAAPGFDTMSFAGDPLFKAAGTDFTPGTGSPLIGKGDTANGSVYDITGKARSIPPAIGAYEP